MGKSHKLFTKGDKPVVIEELEAYQMLIAEQLKRHHNAHSISEYRKVPYELAQNYMKYKDKFLETRSTALKKFDGYIAEQNSKEEVKGKQFSENFKDVLMDTYSDQIDEHLDELLKFAAESKNNKKEYIFKRVNNNHIENESIKELLKNLEKDGDIKINARSKTNLKGLDGKISKYAKSEARYWAIHHVEKHINLTGEFKARNLVKSVDDMFRLMFVKGKYSGNNPNEVLDNLKKYVKEAMDKYEVIGNIDFILDPELFYQSISTTFKKKLTRISENN